MHCTSCALLIDADLEDTIGVKKANTNYAKALTEIEFDADVLTLDKIREIIKKSGYDST